jgi:hypothetical protein
MILRWFMERKKIRIKITITISLKAKILACIGAMNLI